MVHAAVADYLPVHQEGDEHAELKTPQELAIDKMRQLMTRPFAPVLDPLKQPVFLAS